MKYIDLHTGEYEITLLTKEEYQKYNGMHRIPAVNESWWLRSPGHDQGYVSFAHSGGDLFYFSGGVSSYGYYVCCDFCAVRPALKSKVLNLSVGTMFAAIGNTWIMIDDHFAISVDVVSHQKYDDNTNTWETSYLKSWLENWAIDREESMVHDYTIVTTVQFQNVSAENKEQAIEQVKAWLRDGIDTDDGSLDFDVWGEED